MLTATEIAALQACINATSEDLANWRPTGVDEQESHAAMCANVEAAEQALARLDPNPLFVVVYDHDDPEGGDDSPAENYYGYFSDADEARKMFGELQGGDPRYHNASICVQVERIDDISQHDEATDADRIAAILEIDATEGDNMGSELADYLVRAARAGTKSELAEIVKEAGPIDDEDETD